MFSLCVVQRKERSKDQNGFWQTKTDFSSWIMICLLHKYWERENWHEIFWQVDFYHFAIHCLQTWASFDKGLKCWIFVIMVARCLCEVTTHNIKELEYHQHQLIIWITGLIWTYGRNKTEIWIASYISCIPCFKRL